MKRADKRKESTQNKTMEIIEPDARVARTALLCMTVVMSRKRRRLTHVAGHKEAARLGNGVNTIFFAAWRLTTCRRRQHLRPPAQPSRLQPTSPQAQSDLRHQVQRPGLAVFVAGCYGSTVLDSGPSGPCEGFRPQLHAAGCRSCSARLRLDVVREPIDSGSHFESRATAPPILLALTHECGPGSVLPVGRSRLSARFRDGSVNEPPL